MQSHYKTIFYSLLISIFLTSPLYADEVEVVNLTYRPASELIPILKPLLSPGGSITGEKYTLFIRTDKDNLDQLMGVVYSLDVKLRQLRISIIYSDKRTMKRYGIDVSGNVQLQNRNKKLNTGARIYTTDNERNLPAEQVIRVSEGQWANIQSGFSIPTITRTANPNGTVTQSVTYRNVVRQFKVQPRLQTDGVQLAVQAGNPTSPTTVNNVSTIINIRLGQWVSIGSINTHMANSQTGWFYTRENASDTTQQIFVKVELIEDN